MAYVILFFVALIDLLTVSKLSDKEKVIEAKKSFEKVLTKCA